MVSKLAALLAAVLLSASLVACGGPELDQTDDDGMAEDLRSSSEPTDWVSAARKVAAEAIPSPRLVRLSGTQRTSGYSWVFTFYGDGKSFATVKANSRTAKLLDHGTMPFVPTGSSSIDISAVRVNMSDLAPLAKQHGIKGALKAAELSQAVTARPAPHWFAQFPEAALRVNAATGDLE
jgi:hypothetical protein